MPSALVVALAFVAMEPATYLAHRFVMHGVGRALHRSHHVPGPGRFEANDTFPVVFAGLTVLAMAWALNAHSPAAAPVVLTTVGISLYGLAYGLVHDVYIHERLGRLPRMAGLEHLRRAHALHHRFNGEPFGMLLPVVPRSLRVRSVAEEERASTGPA